MLWLRRVSAKGFFAPIETGRAPEPLSGRRFLNSYAVRRYDDMRLGKGKDNFYGPDDGK